jgi:ATP-binding cassette subfamily B protein
MGAVCIASGALLFVQDWRLSLLVVILLPMLYVDFRLVAPRAERASFERQQNAAQVVSTVEEYVLARPVAVAFGLNGRILEHFRGQLATLTASTIRVGFLSGMLSLSAVGGGALLTALVISIGAFMVLHGQLSIGGLVAFYGLVAQVVMPIEWIAVQIQPMTKAVGAFQRLEELLVERPQIADAPDARPLSVLAREIRFEDVTFSYTGARVDLPGLTLTIPAGQSVALVGPSGCGKSTILNLLMRFYDPTLGSISFDGHDLREATQASLRAQTGVVFQESILFNTTVRENIRLGRLDATDAEIEAAARAAEIHDFITSLPNGYDTTVGERGGRLSGGQRQRLAIARAIVRNPPLLLLDEATSALDSEAEAQINATLKRVAKGRTVVSVTHRLAVAADADRIVVLQAGQVVEDGHHAALLEQRGLYYRMWQQQHGLEQEEEARVGAPVLETLRRVPMFRDLDDGFLGSLAAQLVTEEYGAGDLVYAAGDVADRLFIILRGAVEVLSLDPTGTEELLAVLTEGDHFGEMALRRDLPRTTTVRVRETSTFLTLERRSILKNMTNIVTLPHDERLVVLWALRREDVSPAEVAAGTNQDEASARRVLDVLVTKGYLQEVSRNGETRYHARLAPRRESRLAGKIWQALDDR